MVAFRRAALPLLAAVVFLVPAARADSAKRNPFSGLPVSGKTDDGKTFQGTMDVLGFTNEDGCLMAIASVTGTFTTGAAQQVASTIVLVPAHYTNEDGKCAPPAESAAGSHALRAAAPAAQAQATCPILNLVLGPLDLNLLGLTVHLDRVVLDITAVPGAGNLLGNLLCAVANLLNGLNVNLGAALTNAITQLLNNIIAALAGL